MKQFVINVGTHKTTSAEVEGRKEHADRMRQERAARERRGGDPPSVPAGLGGNATPEEVERWTSYKPAKPPGRT